jgi:uncharacterized protein YjbI with pentapeptide repeats
MCSHKTDAAALRAVLIYVRDLNIALAIICLQANAVSDKVLDLRKCNYAGKDLSGKTLSGALLKDAVLLDSKLVEAVLSKVCTG